MSICVLLAIKDEEVRKECQVAIKNLGINYEIVPSVSEVYNTLCHKPFNGVIIDMHMKIKSHGTEKILEREVENIYPVLCLRRDGDTKKILSMYLGPHREKGAENMTMKYFISHLCRGFEARKIRLKRALVNFNVLLFKDNKIPLEDGERCFTIDISKSGCFISSTQNWDNQDHVWFVINELNNNTPILGAIIRHNNWGESMRVPGIGVGFQEIEESQHEKLCEWF
ncbi:MAG: PilZ domain-containing protein [Candidatus Anammoxibacter sp.]